MFMLFNEMADIPSYSTLWHLFSIIRKVFENNDGLNQAGKEISGGNGILFITANRGADERSG